MRARQILLALLVGIVALVLAPTASAKTNVDRCPNQPDVLKVVKGAHERAQKGWNSKTLKKDKNAIERVRIQARCVPTQKGRKHVNEQIDKARAQFKDAKVEHIYGLSSSYTLFAELLAQDTKISLRVIGAWILAEGGPSDNPLNIGPGYHYGSIENGVRGTANLLRSSTYSGIMASRDESDSAQISAIAASPWCPGCAGYESLLRGTYSRVWVK